MFHNFFQSKKIKIILFTVICVVLLACLALQGRTDVRSCRISDKYGDLSYDIPGTYSKIKDDPDNISLYSKEDYASENNHSISYYSEKKTVCIAVDFAAHIDHAVYDYKTELKQQKYRSSDFKKEDVKINGREMTQTSFVKDGYYSYSLLYCKGHTYIRIFIESTKRNNSDLVKLVFDSVEYK